MTFFKWSRTASSNATADSTCPFPEGMAPSAVNDGVRGLMAAAAKYRDDMAGAILTGGSSTAYAIASFQGFDSLARLDGARVAFTPHTGNGATVTLNVDGLGAKPLRSAPGVELPAATLVQGTPHVATYYNATNEFILQGFYSLSTVVPVGAFMPFSSTTVQNSNFILPFGQALSRSVFATYFAMVGTTFGSGDGTATFNAPDLRGRVIAGLDNMGGSAANRITTAGSGLDGVTLGATGGAQSSTIAQANLPAMSPTFTGTSATINVMSSRSDVVFSLGLLPGGNGASGSFIGGNQASSLSSSGSFTPSGTISALGSGTAISNAQPTMALPLLLRVI